MSLPVDRKDTELILELATYAAKAVTREAATEIFERVNALHDKQISRIDSAVGLLSETNARLAATTERVSAISDQMGDTARNAARELVDACVESHKSTVTADQKRSFDKKSMLIAILALVVAAIDKVGPLVLGITGGP